MKAAVVVLIVSTFLLTACSGDSDSGAPAEEGEGSSELSVNRSAPSRSSEAVPGSENSDEASDVPLIEAPRIRGQAESDGNGMETVIYAADRREYQESLQLIAEQSTDQEFQQLDAALRYLMLNDPSIMNNEQRLFEFINGKTGAEIMEATNNLVNNRRRE